MQELVTKWQVPKLNRLFLKQDISFQQAEHFVLTSRTVCF